MEQDIIILYAHRFDKPDDNGNTVVGVSIWFYPAAELTPKRYKADNTYGLIPCKAVLDVNKEHQLNKVPGHYKAIFDQVPSGSEGYQLKLRDVIFHREICEVEPANLISIANGEPE